MLFAALVLLAIGHVRAQFTFAPPPPAPTARDLTDATCALVNVYRASDGKRALAPSRTMTTVAFEHARNLVLYYDWADVQRCNPHSWLDDTADPDRQTWPACCYPLDDCMGPAPRYISSVWEERYHYKGFARENLFWTSGALTPQMAFDAWRQSQGHNATMVWANARTCGAASAGGFLLLWLGSSDDPVPYVSGGDPPLRTVPPTPMPTLPPTNKPTLQPTPRPTPMPTLLPSRAPTAAPSRQPTGLPTIAPTRRPTFTPTHQPTAAPSFTEAPTRSPTISPTRRPTLQPTSSPTPEPVDREEVSRSGALSIAAFVVALFVCLCLALNCCVPKRTVRKRTVRAVRALTQARHNVDEDDEAEDTALRALVPSDNVGDRRPILDHTTLDLYMEVERWERRRQERIHQQFHSELGDAERRRLLAEADVVYEQYEQHGGV